jgi:L-asparagine transporter-like permease
MLERGFLKQKKEEMTLHRKISSTASKITLYLGIALIGGSFVYLLFNAGKSDVLLVALVPFLIVGLGFIVLSQLIKRGFKQPR